MEAKQAISIVNLNPETNKMELTWLKLDYKNQVAHFKTLLKFGMFHHHTDIEKNLKNYSSTFDVTEQEMMHHISDSENDPISTLNDDIDDNSNDSKDENHYNYDDNDDYGRDEDKGCDAFTDVEKKILSSEQLPKILVDKNRIVKFITVIDSGGSPEYIHLLPAFNSYATINFVVFDMTKHLDDPVMVQYKRKHDKEFTGYPLCCSNLNMIELLMCLTTDSLELPAKPMPIGMYPSFHSKSYIAFVGTHKDKMESKSCQERIAEFNRRLTSVVEERGCKSAVIPAENGILFPVDNTMAGTNNSEDHAVKILRQKIENLMDQIKQSDIQLPIRWMILELELQELHQNNGTKYITYEEYKKIAIEKASMVPEEVEESLQHFDFFGVLLHFEKVEGLCDYVIIDHQWLFESLAMIMHLSPDDIDFQNHHLKKQFIEKKVLAKSELSIINWNDNLFPEYLFNLLLYLKVVATVMLNEVEYYYIPCVLPSKIQYHDKYIFLYSAPLLVQFSSGFLPRGFFCSLVVHLLQNLPTGWDHLLHNTEHFSNVITFRLPDSSFLRLHDKTSYLEIQVRHHTKELNFSYHSKVFPVLTQYFKDVCKRLNFNIEKLQYGFLCQDGKSSDDHIAVIKPFEFQLPSELQCCRKCPHLTKLGEFHKIWFKEVSYNIYL